MKIKIFSSLFLLIALGYGLNQFLSRETWFYWGHHFAFENDLGYTIDSLEIQVGDEKTMIYLSPDSSGIMEGNIGVPKEGYPHQVMITLFYNGNSKNLNADSFNCYNCDGSHLYILRPNGAEYRFTK